MRNLIIAIGCLLISFLLKSCISFGNNNDDDFPAPVSNYQPVVVDRVSFEAAVKLVPSQNVVNSGKIYVKDNLMIVNEVNKGFHIYNYSDETNPVKIAFIEIPGATDVAIRNSIFYINQAVDLVTLQYNFSTNSIILLNRNRNVFPQKLSPDGFTQAITDNQIITNWILK